MNAYAILAIIVGVVYGTLFFLIAPLPAGMIIFFITFTASFVTVIMTLVIKEMSSRFMYPVKIRIWEPRRGEPIITENTGAKRINSGGVDYYVTVTGRRIKAPKRQNIIRGEKNSFVDLITTDGEIYFPFVPKWENNDAKFVGLPEDQRTWLADQIESNTKITTPPLDTLAKILPIVTMVTAVGILLAVFLVFTNEMPKFMEETTSVMTAQINALNQSVTTFSDSLDNVVISAREPVQPFIPPPF